MACRIRSNSPLVVNNKVGASGSVGADAVVKSSEDGYTVLFRIDTVFTINPKLFVVSRALGVKSVPKFIAKGKAGNLNLLAGEVDAGIIITPSLPPQVVGGKVQALAVTRQMHTSLCRMCRMCRR